MKKLITLITSFALAVTSIPFTAVCADNGESADVSKVNTSVTETAPPTSADTNSETYVTTTAPVDEAEPLTTTTGSDSEHRFYSFRTVKTYPTKTDYAQGEDLDFTGLTITADRINYANFSPRDYDDYYFEHILDKDYTGETKVTITDKDNKVTDGKDFNALPSGTYTVNITGEIGDYYTNDLCYDLNVTYKVIISEDGAENTLYGDANCDGKVDISDAVLIMQSLANPARYGEQGSDPKHITATGKVNGDVNGNDGITNSDALEIQKYLLKLIDSLPMDYYKTTPQTTTIATTAPVAVTSTTTSATTTLAPLTSPVTTVSIPNDYFYDYVVTGGSGLAQDRYTFKGVETYPTETIITQGSGVNLEGLKFRVNGVEGEKTLDTDFLSGVCHPCYQIIDMDGKYADLDIPGEYIVVFSNRLTNSENNTFTIVTDVDIAYKLTVVPESDNKDTAEPAAYSLQATQVAALILRNRAQFLCLKQ